MPGPIKRPSLKGMKNTGYLGRFSKDKFLQQGHNQFRPDFAFLGSQQELEQILQNSASDLSTGQRQALEERQRQIIREQVTESPLQVRRGILDVNLSPFIRKV